MAQHRNLVANAGLIPRGLANCGDGRSMAVPPFRPRIRNPNLPTSNPAGSTPLIDRLTFPSSIVEALRRLEATSFSAVPEVYGMLLKYGHLGELPLPALRYMTVAGGELRYDLATEIENRIRPAAFHVMYGQSASTARLASLPPE